MSNEAVISGGLNALMLLQRGMEEMQKNPPAQQGPAGPTVAMQAQQAAQQAVSGQPPQDPSAPPPPGQPQPQENGIASIAQNVGTGAQIQAQQQQQAQQAMMAQAQQAQRPPQQMASGGIAGLNTQNMRGFKEGGVLGFARGEEVPKAKEESSSPIGRRAEEFLQNIKEGQDSFLQNIKEGQDSARADYDKKQELLALRQQAQLKFGPSSDVAGLFMNQSDADRAKANKIMSALPSMNEEQLKDLLSGASFAEPRLSQDQIRAMARGKVPVFGEKVDASAMADRLMAIQKAQRANIPQDSEASLELQRRPIDFGTGKGWDDEAKAPVSQGRPSGPSGPSVPRAPTSQSDLEGLIAAMAAGRASVPSTDISKQRALIDQIEAARAAQPNVGIEQLAAYRRAQEEYDTAAKERKESFGSRQFRELMRDMSLNRRGEGMARVGEEERKLTEADTTRRLTNAQLSGHIVDAQNARAVGDLEKKLTAENAITAILQKDAESKAKAGESIASAFGHIAQQRISANSSAANNETQMAIARMKAEQDKINNDILRQDKGFTGYQAAITNNENSRTRRLTEADTAFKDTSNKRLMMLENGSTEDKEKAAEIRAGHNTLLQGINNVFDQDRQKLLMLQWTLFGKDMGMPRPSDAVASTGGTRIKLDQLR